jgi:hypothetical protein
MDPTKQNQRLSPLGGETLSNYHGDQIFIRSKTDSSESSTEDGTELDVWLPLTRKI